MAIQKTEAVVLRTQPFRSSSMIITFFTRDFGKVRGIVKGVRDERQSRAAVFELFNRLEIVYYEKLRSDLQLVSEYFVIDAYDALRSRLNSIGYASYFTELVDKLSEVHDPHPEVFDLLDFSFRYLPALSEERLARIFEVKLLNEIGWLPFLRACIECAKADLVEGYFSPRHGVLLCETCSEKYPDALSLPENCLKAVRYYIRHDLNESIKLPLTARTDKDLAEILRRFFLDRLDYPLKSRQFLDQIHLATK